AQGGTRPASAGPSSPGTAGSAPTSTPTPETAAPPPDDHRLTTSSPNLTPAVSDATRPRYTTATTTSASSHRTTPPGHGPRPPPAVPGPVLPGHAAAHPSGTRVCADRPAPRTPARPCAHAHQPTRHAQITGSPQITGSTQGAHPPGYPTK